MPINKNLKFFIFNHLYLAIQLLFTWHYSIMAFLNYGTFSFYGPQCFVMQSKGPGGYQPEQVYNKDEMYEVWKSVSS